MVARAPIILPVGTIQASGKMTFRNRKKRMKQSSKNKKSRLFTFAPLKMFLDRDHDEKEIGRHFSQIDGDLTVPLYVCTVKK